MSVYVIRAGESNLYKIGWAIDPERRLMELQTGCPFPLRLVAATTGTLAEERHIHEVLNEWHSRGEWFELDADPTPEQIEEWKLTTVPERSTSRGDKPQARWKGWEQDHEPVHRGEEDPVGIPEVAERLGVKRTTVDQWLQRRLLPKPRWTVGGRPAWNWPDVENWARETRRLDRERVGAFKLTGTVTCPSCHRTDIEIRNGALVKHELPTGRIRHDGSRLCTGGA